MFKKGCRSVSILHWRITYLAQMNSKQGFTYKGKGGSLNTTQTIYNTLSSREKSRGEKRKKKFHFSHRPISLRLLCSKRPRFCPSSIRKKKSYSKTKKRTVEIVLQENCGNGHLGTFFAIKYPLTQNEYLAKYEITILVNLTH